MKYETLNIPGMAVMHHVAFEDKRGYFAEIFRDDEFRKVVADVSFVQDNSSGSCMGCLRGLHYQIKQSQGKLVRVTRGTVFDVGVDLRRSSPTFGQWAGRVLSEEKREMLWIPPGFAHGFYVMSEFAEFCYKCTDYYVLEHERTIAWDDPDIGIKWPLVDGQPPLLSERDQNGVAFKRAEVFI